MFLGDSNIIWKESNRVISAGTTIIRKDPRLSLEDGYNLRIDDLQETDSGIKLTKHFIYMAKNEELLWYFFR